MYEIVVYETVTCIWTLTSVPHIFCAPSYMKLYTLQKTEYITKNQHLSIHIQKDKYQYTHFQKHTHMCILLTYKCAHVCVCAPTHVHTHACVLVCRSVSIMRLTFWDSPYFRGELQCVAVCCSALQSAAVCCWYIQLTDLLLRFDLFSGYPHVCTCV